jgi:hypothetical protein
MLPHIAVLITYLDIIWIISEGCKNVDSSESAEQTKYMKIVKKLANVAKVIQRMYLFLSQGFFLPRPSA